MLPQPDSDKPEYGSGPANPDAVKDFWIQTLKPAAEAGRLGNIPPTFKAVSTRGRDIARKQNHVLTRKVFGMPEGYEHIKWNHRQPEPELVDLAFID